MPNKLKLNFDAPFLSVRRIRSRSGGTSNDGSTCGSMRLCDYVPFSWEDVAGHPKYPPQVDDDNYNGDIEDDDADDDVFSDAHSELSFIGFAEGGLSSSKQVEVEGDLKGEIRFVVELREGSDEEEMSDEGEMLKGCGFMRRIWLGSGAPFWFVAIGAVIGKPKKHLVRALARRSSDPSKERGEDHKRTWKAALMSKLGMIRQQSKAQKEEGEERRSIYHKLSCPSSPYPTPLSYPPPISKRRWPFLHSSMRSIFQEEEEEGGIHGAPPVVSSSTSTPRMSRRKGMDGLDPMYYADGAIHIKRTASGLYPPKLNSPSGSWIWRIGANSGCNSPSNSFMAMGSSPKPSAWKKSCMERYANIGRSRFT